MKLADVLLFLFAVLVLALNLYPSDALAQTAAGVAEGLPQSPTGWTILIAVLSSPFAAMAAKLIFETLLTLAKAKGIKSANAWERAYRIADSAIGYVDAATASARAKATSPDSDGGREVTKREAAELQALALKAATDWLGQGGLDQLAKEAGVAANVAGEWLKGVIESRFNVKKIAEVAAEASPAVFNLGAPVESKGLVTSPR